MLTFTGFIASKHTTHHFPQRPRHFNRGHVARKVVQSSFEPSRMLYETDLLTRSSAILSQLPMSSVLSAPPWQ